MNGGINSDHHYGENLVRPIDPSGSNWKHARFEAIAKLSDTEEGKLPCTVGQTPHQTTVTCTDGNHNVYTIEIKGFGKDNLRHPSADHSSESHSSNSGEFEDRSGEDTGSQHSDTDGRSYVTGRSHTPGDLSDFENGYGHGRGGGSIPHRGQHRRGYVNKDWSEQPGFSGFAGRQGDTPNGHYTQYDPHDDSISSGSSDSRSPYWATMMIYGQEQRIPVSIYSTDDLSGNMGHRQQEVVFVFQAKRGSRIGQLFKGIMTGGTNLVKAGVRKTLVTPTHFGFRLANGISELTENKVGNIRERLRDPYATGFRKFLKTGTRKLVVSPTHTALRVGSALTAVGEGLSGATRKALRKRPGPVDYDTPRTRGRMYAMDPHHEHIP